MKLSEVKDALKDLTQVRFVLPDGKRVPQHFHVTEVGRIEKHFVDCGGTVRRTALINFQLFTADDYDHRLSASKLKSIIEVSEKMLALEDLEVEVEYQDQTIGKYQLEFEDDQFHLVSTKTDCLAKDNCGIPVAAPSLEEEVQKSTSKQCVPGSGCC